MSDYSGLLANKGPRPKYTDPDTKRVYELSYLTIGKMAIFEQGLKDDARRLLVEAQRDLPKDVWKEEWAQFRDDCAAGAFSFLGDVATRARETPMGAMRLMAILMGCSPDELMDLFSRRGAEVLALLEQIITESYPKKAEGSDPNPTGPATTGPSL